MANNIIKIHGKDYMTVAGRVQLAHVLKKLSITTEVLPVVDQVVVKATVVTDKGTFTGISSANTSKMIEKLNPYEVAETSAVGRALGFAGYGVIEGIASADEMAKADQTTTTSKDGVTTTKPVGQVDRCDDCERVISPNVKTFSMNNFGGRKLCMDCQELVTNSKPII